MEVIIAQKARGDIASMLAWTEESFGPRMSKRYGNLIATAIGQVAANPELAGSLPRPEIADQFRTYHLFFSWKSADRSDQIRRPRHFLIYRVTEPGRGDIGR